MEYYSIYGMFYQEDFLTKTILFQDSYISRRLTIIFKRKNI